MAILKVKIGIDMYRAISILLSLMCSLIFFMCWYFQRDLLEIIIYLVLTIIFVLLSIFMESIAYFLHLPTKCLIFTKEELIYQKKKKEIIYKLSNAKIKFHSFFENFESLSRIHIIYDDREDYFPVTKKQYKKICEFLNKTNQK